MSCPPERPARGPAPRTGNASTANAAMNAVTSLPANSPLAGLPDPYREDDDWAKMPKGRVFGDDRAIAIDKDGRHIWIVDRCDLTGSGCAKPENKNVNPIMEFDPQGNLVKSFGAGMFSAPHGVTVDKNGNVYTADGGPQDGCQPAGQPVGNKLRKWSPDGKLLMTISGPVAGKPFTGLNDVVVSPINGDIFVADGHSRPANDRILKFDKNGKFLLAWGQPGDADTDIGIPHGLAIDKEGGITSPTATIRRSRSTTGTASCCMYGGSSASRRAFSSINMTCFMFATRTPMARPIQSSLRALALRAWRMARSSPMFLMGRAMHGKDYGGRRRQHLCGYHQPSACRSLHQERSAPWREDLRLSVDL